MLHFTRDEFDTRMARLRGEMSDRGLDAMLLFAQESDYWLSGYDSFGFCFFQCLVVSDHDPVLLTRSADLRQAQLTSNITDIRIWRDGAGVDPSHDLKDLLAKLGLQGKRLGWETDTHGLTALNGQRVANRLQGWAELVEASDLVPALRLIKSPAEIACVRRAAEIGDAAYEAALAEICPGADEARILQRLQGEVFALGGDYPGNEFILGSGANALLCRYYSGRRRLEAQDQITLEWAGVWRHYHAALMRTVCVGRATPEHLAAHGAAEEALLACEAALRPGHAMADVYDAHVRVLDAHGLGAARLNACGYALGARFTPSWMEPQMFYEGAPTVMQPGMVFFLHMIIMESDTGTAMCLGRTSLVTETGAEPLSRLPLSLEVRT